jgi:hypothetical protein
LDVGRAAGVTGDHAKGGDPAAGQHDSGGRGGNHRALAAPGGRPAGPAGGRGRFAGSHLK